MTEISSPVPVPKSSTNKKIFRVLLLLFVIGVSYLFFTRIQSYYNGITSGTLDISAFAVQETSQLSNVNTSANVSTVASPRLVDFTNDPTLGSKSAPVQIVMFADFECPYCRKVFSAVKSMLAKHANDVYFVFRDLPIVELHPGAQLAAEAAQCAYAQGKFWPYHDKLYLAGSTNTVESLKLFARQLNLQTAQFDSCLDNHFYAQEVQSDYEDALALGVTGTPTFFINGNKVAGVISAEGFDKIIEYFKNK